MSEGPPIGSKSQKQTSDNTMSTPVAPTPVGENETGDAESNSTGKHGNSTPDLFTQPSPSEPPKTSEHMDETAALPEVLVNLAANGVSFRHVTYSLGQTGRKFAFSKHRSVFFSLDTPVTSQQILEGFDKAGIDVDDISSIQRRASNNTWIVSFCSPSVKQKALSLASVDISGCEVFLGDSDNQVTLVKIYECPTEMPDTVLIGRLACYGRVLSFRRDRLSVGIENGVRTARMQLIRHIPSVIGLVGEFIRIWYPSQPKTCRRCGDDGHLARDCSSRRCFNCDRPGHVIDTCPELELCSICLASDHVINDCPFVIYAGNVVRNDSNRPHGEEKSQGSSSYAAAAASPPKEVVGENEHARGDGEKQAKREKQKQENEHRKKEQQRRRDSERDKRAKESGDQQADREKEDRRERRRKEDEKYKEDYEQWLRNMDRWERRNSDRERDHSRDRSRSDHGRDRSSYRRGDSGDEDSAEDGWKVVSRRKGKGRSH